MADPHPGGIQRLQVPGPAGEADQQRKQHQFRPEAAAGVRGEQYGHDGQVGDHADGMMVVIMTLQEGVRTRNREVTEL